MRTRSASRKTGPSAAASAGSAPSSKRQRTLNRRSGSEAATSSSGESENATPVAAAVTDDEGRGTGETESPPSPQALFGRSPAHDNEGGESSFVRVTPRENGFSSRTWWMVDLQCDSDPPVRQGATALVARCIRTLGWTEEHARRVLKAYRQFLELKTLKRDWDATMLSPCERVDEMWHQHILDVTNYCHDAMLLCDGHVVGHDPDGMLDEAKLAERRKATLQALKERYGEDGFDERPWLSGKEIRAKEAKEAKRKRLEQLMATKTVHELGTGRSGRISGNAVTIIVELENRRVQLIKFAKSRKMSSVLQSYHRTVYPDDDDLADLAMRVYPSHLDLSDTGFFSWELWNHGNQTADILNLEDGDAIEVCKQTRVISITVCDQNGEEISFWVMNRAPLSKIFSSYARMKGVSECSLRFLLDGQRISGDQTPQYLEMTNHEKIDCMLELGGC